MPCFGGVFRHWLRGLGGLGDSGGPDGPGRPVRTESWSLGDALLRKADVDIPSARGSRALGGVVVGSRHANTHLETRDSARLCVHNPQSNSRTSSIHDTRRKTYVVVGIRSLTICLRLRPAVSRSDSSPTRLNSTKTRTGPSAKQNHPALTTNIANAVLTRARMRGCRTAWLRQKIIA